MALEWAIMRNERMGCNIFPLPYDFYAHPFGPVLKQASFCKIEAEMAFKP